MPPRPNAVRVSLTRLGRGEVILDEPPGDLIPAEEVVDGPGATDATNLRFRNNLAIARPGYAILGTSPTTDPVIGLINAIFDDGTSALVRGDASTIQTWNGSAWSDITGAATFTGGNTDYWALAMVERTGSVSPKNQLFLANGVDGIYKWTGTGNIASVSGSPTGARVLVPFLDRCFAMNVEDSGADRKHARVQWPVSGDPETWTGTGSGSVDLNEDPFPIANAAVMGGALIIYKGGVEGGSVWRATKTGDVDNPLRYDALNPGSGIGLLMRRTLILISPALASFFGHDGWYLHDGFTGLQPIATGITESILDRVNRDALDAAFSWYRPRTREIHLNIPVGGSSTPNETWVYSMKTQRVHGPYAYADALTAVSPYVQAGGLTWGTLPASTWSTLPYSSWGAIGGSVSALSIVFGTAAGDAVEDTDDPSDDDNGTAIDTSYTTGEVRAEGRRLPGGRVGVAGDYLTLQDVRLTYRDDMAWTPEVQVSIDGEASWTTISDGSSVGGGTTRMRNVTYTTGEITGERFQIRVQGANAVLHSIHLEFTYGGDEASS